MFGSSQISDGFNRSGQIIVDPKFKFEVMSAQKPEQSPLKGRDFGLSSEMMGSGLETIDHGNQVQSQMQASEGAMVQSSPGFIPNCQLGIYCNQKQIFLSHEMADEDSCFLTQLEYNQAKALLVNPADRETALQRYQEVQKQQKSLEPKNIEKADDQPAKTGDQSNEHDKLQSEIKDNQSSNTVLRSQHEAVKVHSQGDIGSN